MGKGLKIRLLLTVVSAFLWLTQQPAAAQLTSTDAWGPLFQARQPCAAPSMPPQVADSVRRWNAIAMSANALDHTPVAPGENRRSEEHTSELQSLAYLVCRLLLEKKKKKITYSTRY